MNNEMLAYYAFKALSGDYPRVLSPQQGTRWELNPSLDLPSLRAKALSFELGHGVYAAAFDVADRYAKRYNGRVYLVAPLPGKHAVVGEDGWRAEGALCLGPITQENQAQVAHLIVAAAAKDLPQVPAVLRWAIKVASQAEGRLVCPPNVDLLDLWRSGEETTWLESLLPYLDRAENRLAIARRLLAMHDAGDIPSAGGLCWAIAVASQVEGALVLPKTVRFADLLALRSAKGYAVWLGRLTPYLADEQLSQLCDALLRAGEVGALADIRQAWLERDPFPVEIGAGEMGYRKAWDALALARLGGVSNCPQSLLRAAFDFALSKGDLGWVYQLGVCCDDERWAKTIREALLAAPHPELLYRAGRDWPAACYDEAIARALVGCKDARCLYLAGKDWPDERYRQEIRQALIKRRDARYLYLAGRHWPTDRYGDDILSALARAKGGKWLYMAGLDWPAERYTDAILEALCGGASARYLYAAGLSWPDERYREDILKTLARTGSAAYIRKAMRRWPRRRVYNFNTILYKELLKFVDELACNKKLDLRTASLKGARFTYRRFLFALAALKAGNPPPALAKSALRHALNADDPVRMALLGAHLPDPAARRKLIAALVKHRAFDLLCAAGADWSDDATLVIEALRAHPIWLYQAGLTWPNKANGALSRALIASQDAELIYKAGRNWPDDHYSPDLLAALLATKNAKWLYLAGRDWPDGRYSPDLLATLLATKNAEWLYFAGRDWPEARYDEAIAHALIETGNAEHLYRAGMDWSAERYRESIAEALLKTGNAEYLYLAGRDWPDGRYPPDLLAVLLATKNAKWLYLAGRDWPEARFSAAILDALLASCEWDYICLAGRDWPNGRYHPSIAVALLGSGYPAALYGAGASWPDERYSDEFRSALIQTGCARWLIKAVRDWPEGRYSEALLSAFIERATPNDLYWAGIDLPDDRYSPQICAALIRSGDEYYIEEARRCWPAERARDIGYGIGFCQSA